MAKKAKAFKCGAREMADQDPFDNPFHLPVIEKSMKWVPSGERSHRRS